MWLQLRKASYIHIYENKILWNEFIFYCFLFHTLVSIYIFYILSGGIEDIYVFWTVLFRLEWTVQQDYCFLICFALPRNVLKERKSVSVPVLLIRNDFFGSGYGSYFSVGFGSGSCFGSYINFFLIFLTYILPFYSFLVSVLGCSYDEI